MDKTIKPPVGWGEDSLSEFQEITMNNEMATFESLPEYNRLLTNVDVVLQSCVEQCLKQFFKGGDMTGMLLFTNAHNHFRATVRLATSGQCVSAYPTGRAGLESALYAWYLSVDADAAEAWHNKPAHADREAFRRWSNMFKFSSMTKLIESQDLKLAEHIAYLHQQAIDFGAHPNSDALYSNVNVYKKEGKDSLITLTYLHPNGLLFSQTFRFLVEVGMVTLRLINLASQEVSKLVKLESCIAELQKQYDDLLSQIMANAHIPNSVRAGDRVKVVNK